MLEHLCLQKLAKVALKIKEISPRCVVDEVRLESIGAPFLARCAKSHLPPTAPAASQVEVYEGALAFIDISGFSRLSELLSERHGAEGAELLQTYINRYFRSLIEAALASPPTALQWVVSPRRPTAPRRSWSNAAATS